MPVTGLSAQVGRVEALERELSAARSHVGSLMRVVREEAGMSLRDVAVKARTTAATLSNIETGKHWRSTTVKRVVRFYEALSAA